MEKKSHFYYLPINGVNTGDVDHVFFNIENTNASKKIKLHQIILSSGGSSIIDVKRTTSLQSTGSGSDITPIPAVPSNPKNIDATIEKGNDITGISGAEEVGKFGIPGSSETFDYKPIVPIELGLNMGLHLLSSANTTIEGTVLIEVEG